MNQPLPVVVHCEDLVNRQAFLSGELSVEQCPRLQEMCLEGKEGTVGASLQFERTPQGYAVISGLVWARLPVLCQRCLEPMTLTVETSVMLHPALPNTTAAWQEEKEVVVLNEEGLLSIVDLIEEECLLSCPIVPKHPETECGVLFEQPPTESKEKKINPFAVLKGLS
jgi:uncharacterized protein